ncbi:hypothetical protein F5B22DRAFT_641145 [Xylaria bambusicola]|uniref:uncharacterized protein n=1 Tax=Xylaria bambusicola TaxID=326684 RepID=UPI00200751BA|nr:uncharacterized protein F5B22DRAFT_641145 [Xylaria bambusicola]KAI0528172.1 hypothetical protein F5B22DRAFT_641145 [Xylaria bambusicola]
MASRNRQGKCVQRSVSRTSRENSSDTEAESTASGPAFKRRQASLYDAVAGRVTTTRPLHSYDPQRSSVKYSKRNDPNSHRNPVLSPEEVLFRRAGAPIRYAEKDIYHAHEDLPEGGRNILPDSDLLKTIHSYASHFYEDLPANKQAIRSETGEGISERSMDETALLAFGILLEEAGREALGQKGDLVFTEGVVEEGEEEDGAPQVDDEDAEVFGFLDGTRYEARGRLKRP